MPQSCPNCGSSVGLYQDKCSACGTPNPWFEQHDREVASAADDSKSGGRSLRFRLLDISVSVHWSFLLVALLGVGSSTGVEIAVWTLAAFLAVLLHEMGHALTARRFGAEPVAIRLFAFGGVTTWPTSSALSPGRRFIATGAGSGVGILAGGALALVARSGAIDGLGTLPFFAITSFIFASLIWGVLNWIPIRPLDGGQMTFTLLEVVTPRAAESLSRAISLVTGGVVVLGAILLEDYFAAVFVALIVLFGLRAPPRPGSEGLAPRKPDTAAEEPSGFSGSDSIVREVPSEQPTGELARGEIPADSPEQPDYGSSGLPEVGSRARTAVWMTAALLGVFTVVGLVLATLADVVSTTETSPTDLAVGDCFEELPKGTKVFSIDVIPCDQPHGFEVYKNESLGSFFTDYPGPDVVSFSSSLACLEGFEAYVGTRYGDSVYDVNFLSPAEESWSLGDTTVTCVVTRLDGRQTTGTARNSRE